jgi:hypothetical protein
MLDDLLRWGDEILEQCGERAAIDGDVQSAVVLEKMYHGVAEVLPERIAVVVPATGPLMRPQAGAVYQDKHLARAANRYIEQRVAQHSHLDGEWIVGLAQVIAEHAIERSLAARG